MIPVHIGDLSLFSTVTFKKELYVFGKMNSNSVKSNWSFLKVATVVMLVTTSISLQNIQGARKTVSFFR